MSELAAHPGVRQQFPVIAQALELSASAQLRNMASIGGNLMQRPRCLYFRDVNAACNRRTPGAGCAAIGGRNRTHWPSWAPALPASATHPSDLAVALVALDAVVITRDGNGEQPVKIADFFRQPGDTPRPGTQPRTRCADHRRRDTRPTRHPSVGVSQVRDRASYEFALTSAAVAIDIPAGCS